MAELLITDAEVGGRIFLSSNDPVIVARVTAAGGDVATIRVVGAEANGDLRVEYTPLASPPPPPPDPARALLQILAHAPLYSNWRQDGIFDGYYCEHCRGQDTFAGFTHTPTCPIARALVLLGES